MRNPAPQLPQAWSASPCSDDLCFESRLFAGFRTSLVVLRFDPFANLELRSGWRPRVITANRTLGSRLAVDSIKL